MFLQTFASVCLRLESTWQKSERGSPVCQEVSPAKHNETMFNRVQFMVQFLNQVQTQRKGKLPLLMHRLVTPSRKLQTWLTWAHQRCAKWRRRLSKQQKIHRQSGLKSAGLGRRGMLLRWKRLAWKPQSHFAHKIVINIWYWQVCSAQATKRIQEANLFYLQAAEESSKRAKEREQLSQPEPESFPVSIDPLFNNFFLKSFSFCPQGRVLRDPRRNRLPSY